MDLSFSLESGRNLPVFTRFEGPISVRLTGKVPQSLPSELNRLIHRLQDEANLDTYYTSADQANVNVHAVCRRQIQRTLPMAACFVAHNIINLEDFKASRKTAKTSWSAQTERRMVSLFIPSDASPQEIRDCLHEEFAQGLGPLNDLYRLPNSVFNDDNIHTILTDFDMMVLRATYAPELRSGMTRAEVVARLPTILGRINPAGEGVAYRALPPTSRARIKEIQTALSPATPAGDRMGAAWGPPRVPYTWRRLRNTTTTAWALAILPWDALFNVQTGMKRYACSKQRIKCSVNPRNQPLCGAYRRAAGVLSNRIRQGPRGACDTCHLFGCSLRGRKRSIAVNLDIPTRRSLGIDGTCL
jgi:hypothetical protein